MAMELLLDYVPKNQSVLFVMKPIHGSGNAFEVETEEMSNETERERKWLRTLMKRKMYENLSKLTHSPPPKLSSRHWNVCSNIHWINCTFTFVQNNFRSNFRLFIIFLPFGYYLFYTCFLFLTAFSGNDFVVVVCKVSWECKSGLNCVRRTSYYF